MAQYWLQTPIENAKEVVQRFIDDNIATLPGLTGKKVSYTELTEVIYYQSNTPASPYLSNEILFGTWYIANAESNAYLSITDGTNYINTFDPSSGLSPTESGHYPYIIWNYLGFQPNEPSYFVGYKFKLA